MEVKAFVYCRYDIVVTVRIFFVKLFNEILFDLTFDTLKLTFELTFDTLKLTFELTFDTLKWILDINEVTRDTSN